jgi:hypothetical protein
MAAPKAGPAPWPSVPHVDLRSLHTTSPFVHPDLQRPGRSPPTAASARLRQPRRSRSSTMRLLNASSNNASVSERTTLAPSVTEFITVVPYFAFSADHVNTLPDLHPTWPPSLFSRFRLEAAETAPMLTYVAETGYKYSISATRRIQFARAWTPGSGEARRNREDSSRKAREFLSCSARPARARPKSGPAPGTVAPWWRPPAPRRGRFPCVRNWLPVSSPPRSSRPS